MSKAWTIFSWTVFRRDQAPLELKLWLEEMGKSQDRYPVSKCNTQYKYPAPANYLPGIAVDTCRYGDGFACHGEATDSLTIVLARVQQQSSDPQH